MIVEHSATVIPFSEAVLRSSRKRLPLVNDERTRADGELPDNVIALARFSRRSRRAHRRFWLGDPPDGEAA